MTNYDIETIKWTNEVSYHFDHSNKIEFYDWESDDIVPLPDAFAERKLFSGPWLLHCHFDERAVGHFFGESIAIRYTLSFKNGETIGDVIAAIEAKPCYGYFEGFRDVGLNEYVLKWGT